LTAPLAAQAPAVPAAAPLTSAQVAATARQATADTAWANLATSKSNANAAAKASGPVSATAAAAERLARAQKYRAVAEGAKDFTAQYPEHAKAPEARKLEATAGIAGIADDDPAQERSALATAAAYRTDKKNPAHDRFDVAVAVEHHQLGRRLGGKPPSSNPTEYEKVADGLHKEFGELPEVYGFYAGVARSVDHNSANRIASKMLEMSPPPGARAQAQAITSRYGLLGRPLDLALTDLAGKKIEIGKNAKETVLYVSTTDGGAGSAGFYSGIGAKALANQIPKQTDWVYLYLGATPAQISTAKAKAPFAGAFCVDPKGLSGAAARRLKIRSSPCVVVFDKKGRLSGFGRPDELPTLLAEASAKGGAQ
jgi:hypothetical protein